MGNREKSKKEVSKKIVFEGSCQKHKESAKFANHFAIIIKVLRSMRKSFAHYA